MEHRTLEINVMSARDLNKVNLITKMDVYVVVYVSGDGVKHKQKTKTHVDKDGGSNPTWNFPMKFSVDEATAHQNRLTFVFKLKCERVLGDKDIGEVHVPITELIQSVEAFNGMQQQHQFVSYQVRKPNGKPKGQISFSYTFGEKVAAPPVFYKAEEPVTAYPAAVNHIGPSSAYAPPGGYPPAAHQGAPPPPGGYPPAYHQGAPPSQGGYGYPPPPPYGGYPPPPHSGYGYAPQPGYGYPQVQQPPKKNNKYGLGLGAGLLGGALGGLLIGDMVSDGFDF